MVDFSKGGCLTLRQTEARYEAALRLVRYSFLREQLLDAVDAIIGRDGRMNNAILGKVLGVDRKAVRLLRAEFPTISSLIFGYMRLKKGDRIFLSNGKQVGGGGHHMKGKQCVTLKGKIKSQMERRLEQRTVQH